MTSQLWDLRAGLPDSLEVDGNVYLLGVGGPEDESGIGKPDRFVWRFSTLEEDGKAPILIAFGAMPILMRFTRAVNERQPFSLPTEALKMPAGDLSGTAARLLLNPSPADFENLRAERSVGQQRIPELGG